MCLYFFFFFNDTATTEIYTLSLHDALPISQGARVEHLLNGRPEAERPDAHGPSVSSRTRTSRSAASTRSGCVRSEEHTSELQSRQYLVCRLLLEKKKR